MSTLDPRDYDLQRLRIDASRIDCPNGPDEEGLWPCDPQGYFGVMECQVCGRVGVLRNEMPAGEANGPPPESEEGGER
jgi:hypothetical protein